jgi:hypothetical protein
LLGVTAVLLGVAGLALAVVLTSGTSSGNASGATSDTVPAYYAETIAIRPPAYDSPLNLSIRFTNGGGEKAALRLPQPDESIGFVVGTGQPRRWIVGALPWHPLPYDNSAQPAQLYLATLVSTTVDDNPMDSPSLTPLPVAPMRATQLIDGTADRSEARQLAAATLSPDGRRLALVTTQGNAYQVSVSPVTGHGATRTWSGQVNASSKPFEWGFSLTWLSDDKTLAVGIATGAADAMADSTAAVRYLNTASPGSSVAAASRTVTLSFPAQKAKAGTPDGCYGAPVAASDAPRVLCPGTATHRPNDGGATAVGLWVFSARSGALTAAWNEHTICCSLSSTNFPRIRWVSPRGTLVIASGMSTENQGAQLFLRNPGGVLRQLPWPGLIHRPNQVNIIEPSIAW